MLMKGIIVLCFLCFNVCISQTTTLEVTESLEFKDEIKSDNVLSIYTNNSSVTGIIREAKKNFLFDVFDASLNKTYSELIDKSKKETFVGDVYFDNTIRIFTLEKVNKSDRVIHVYTFDIEKKSYQKVQLFSTTVEKNQPLFSGGNKRQTSFALSPNGNYLAIATDDIKKNLNSYTVRVFDANSLKLLHKKSYQEDQEKFFIPNDLVVDDFRNAYVLGKKYNEGRREKKNGEANYQFILNKVSDNNVEELVLELDSKEHIRSLNISQSSENELQILGFYSENRAGNIKGGCNFTIDIKQGLSIKKKINNALPLSVYEDLFGNNRAERKEGKELRNFYVDFILEDNSGNTYIIAEEFYITTTYVSNGTMGGHYITTYHYDDILILKFNAEKQLDWGRSIFKKSTVPSYNAFLKDDQLHILLNSGKNLIEKNDGRTKVSKGWFESSSLYDVLFTINGEVSYNKIQDNKGNNYYTPYLGTYKNDKFVMMSDGNRRKQFMILE